MTDKQFDKNATWHITGIVDIVRENELVLWVDGFDELQIVPRSPIMPEWMLVPETPFRTAVPRSCIRQRNLNGNASWGYFEKQEFANLTDDELMAELNRVFGSVKQQENG